MIALAKETGNVGFKIGGGRGDVGLINFENMLREEFKSGYNTEKRLKVNATVALFKAMDCGGSDASLGGELADSKSESLPPLSKQTGHMLSIDGNPAKLLNMFVYHPLSP